VTGSTLRLNEIVDNSQIDIKALQIQLTGFLGENAPGFCKELWNLCLSAQDSDTGVPQQLLDAKTSELRQQKVKWRSLTWSLRTLY